MHHLGFHGFHGGAFSGIMPASFHSHTISYGVSRDSVVKCLTRNPGVPVSSCTRSSWFFLGVFLGRILHSPSLVLMKPRKDMNNVSCCCCCDMTEIPINQPCFFYSTDLDYVLTLYSINTHFFLYIYFFLKMWEKK